MTAASAPLGALSAIEFGRHPGTAVLPQRPKPKLSPREVEVMLHWFANDSKTATCKELFITMGTVNTHLNRIRDKYQAIGRPAQTKAALLARALQDGLIKLEDL